MMTLEEFVRSGKVTFYMLGILHEGRQTLVTQSNPCVRGPYTINDSREIYLGELSVDGTLVATWMSKPEQAPWYMAHSASFQLSPHAWVTIHLADTRTQEERDATAY